MVLVTAATVLGMALLPATHRHISREGGMLRCSGGTRCSIDDEGVASPLAIFVVASGRDKLPCVDSEAELALRAAGINGLVVDGACMYNPGSACLPRLCVERRGQSEHILVDAGGRAAFRAVWLCCNPGQTALDLQETVASELAPTQQWMASLAAGSMDELSRSVFDAWLLRTTAGCGAVTLRYEELLRCAGGDTATLHGGWAPVVRALARMKRPVSAVDYPPSVYMIGEDEAATVAEVDESSTRCMDGPRGP